MPSQGAIRAADGILRAIERQKLPLYDTGGRKYATAIIDRETGVQALRNDIILALANSVDLNLTERQINVMREIVMQAGKD